MTLRPAKLPILSLALSLGLAPTIALADEVDDVLGGGESKPAAKPKTTTPDAKTAPAKAEVDDDVIVVERKSFLRSGRIEIGPAVGLTLNDPFLQHTGLGLMFDYHITEALAVGIRGMYFFDNNTDVIRETVRLQSVPLLNRYDWVGSVTIHYIPIYGKFAFFGRSVLHFDTYVGAGIGAISTTVLVAPTFVVPGKTDYGPTVNVGAGARLYLTKFLALYCEIRDYFLLIDPEDRKTDQPRYFAGNMLFGFGVSIFLPSSFKYTTPR